MRGEGFSLRVTEQTQ